METSKAKICNCDDNSFSLTHKTIVDLGVMLIISMVVVYALHRVVSKHL